MTPEDGVSTDATLTHTAQSPYELCKALAHSGNNVELKDSNGGNNLSPAVELEMVRNLHSEFP
jgi:hypothetical protein